MSNIYLKVTVEKKWRSQNFDFLSLKILSLGQFLGYPTLADIIEFSIFLFQLKNQKSESKIVCGFSITYFGKNYGVLKLESPCFLLSKNINFNKNETKLKMENPTNSFREMNYVLQLVSESQIKRKTVMSWSSQRKKECIFCNVCFVPRIFV